MHVIVLGYQNSFVYFSIILKCYLLAEFNLKAWYLILSAKIIFCFFVLHFSMLIEKVIPLSYSFLSGRAVQQPSSRKNIPCYTPTPQFQCCNMIKELSRRSSFCLFYRIYTNQEWKNQQDQKSQTIYQIGKRETIYILFSSTFSCQEWESDPCFGSQASIFLVVGPPSIFLFTKMGIIDQKFTWISRPKCFGFTFWTSTQTQQYLHECKTTRNTTTSISNMKCKYVMSVLQRLISPFLIFKYISS